MQKKSRILAIAIAAYACLSVLVVFIVYKGRFVGNAAPGDSETLTATSTPAVVEVLTVQNRIEALDQVQDIARLPWQTVEVVAKDTERIQDRFALPNLARMGEEERVELVEHSQTLKRMAALGIDAEEFQTPELNWKTLYNYVNGYVAKNVLEKENTLAFEGGSLSELNALIGAAGESARIEVRSPELIMDETLLIPSDIYVDGGNVRLIPAEEILDKAIVLDNAQRCGVSGFVIDGGCNYGVYIKNSGSFVVSDNDIAGAAYKGIVMMGSGDRFSISRNHVHGNLNGGIFLNGGMGIGLLEGNQVIDNSGARNLTAGIVLCSIEIRDMDTAYNEFKDVHLYDILESPNNLVLYNNRVAYNHSSGIYSDSGYLNYIISNEIYKNEKEGMCLDYGSFGNFIARNIIQSNGGRNRMTDEDLKADFVLELGRLSDGSSPAKLPGVSLDNTAYNTLYCNVVSMNYGSGIKAVRSAYRNLLLCNEVSDNNLGVSEAFHFFGIELSTDMNADEEVTGLDFTPCYENIVAQNTVSGAHYAGIFLGPDGYINDFFDNSIHGCTNWSMENLSDRFNASVNNISNVQSRRIALSNSNPVIAVAGAVD